MRGVAILQRLDRVQQDQRGALMPWAAVVLGLGVGLYFALPVEPGVIGYTLGGLGMIVGLGLALWRHEGLGPLGLALFLVCLGLVVAGLRSHAVAGPVIGFRYYGAIEGRIVGIDRSASDALRLTLDQVRLEDLEADRLPRRVRVSLLGDQRWLDPEPGARVMMTGHLSAPEGPAEPGGFDFQRHAWFQSLGAVGYARTPAVLLESRPSGTAPLFHLRMRISAVIQTAIPGQPGAFASAVLTGDRSGLDAGSTQDMRDANIAHLLAISGLHMGLLTGFIYGALRAVLALIPPLALRYPIRKWAAAVALAVGAFYLALSGAGVATERAFIQVAVMLTAVMLDRRAITLRSVALAAIIVLLHRPETLMGPGFQMSFAATVALVAVFNAIKGAEWLRALPWWTKGAMALLMSSLVAGAATGPYAAAHFNRIAVYGLPANLLTVPIMGSIIIPGAVVAVLLWPFGLSWVAVWVMEKGLVWILGVSARVADMPGAVDMVPSPPLAMLPVLTLGALMVILWRGGARWLGAAPVAIAFLIWISAERPALLISDSGGLVGVLTEEGRALSRPSGESFVASIWLENDGDLADQPTAAARPGWMPEALGSVAQFGSLSIWHGAGRRALAEAEAACATHDLVVLSEPVPDNAPTLLDAERLTMAEVLAPPIRAGTALASTPGTACRVLTPQLLRRTGALAITLEGDRMIFDAARAQQGRRLWVR